MKKDFISRGREVPDRSAHLVLTTKYRRKVFTGEILERLGEILDDLCQKWDCKLVEAKVEEDHIHLLFQYYPQMELSKFINNIKTVTSRRGRRKNELWNGSYFIASCGGTTVATLRKYIES